MFSELHEVFFHGGIILWAIILLGISLYSLVGSALIELSKIKRILGSLPTGSPKNLSKLSKRDTQSLDKLSWVKRRLTTMRVLIVATPLTGLLGTVSGMLDTFSLLGSPNSVQPIDGISMGISQALITTQAGLIVAIPASFFLAFLTRRTHVLESTSARHAMRFS